jgi:penicillin-binding protein 1A
MLRNELITPQAMDSLSELPLEITYTPESHREGLATYFRAYLKEFMDGWIKANPKPDGTKHNLYRDGLRIFTTIDSRMQNLGEEAVNAHMKNLQKGIFETKYTSRESNSPFFRFTKRRNRYAYVANSLSIRALAQDEIGRF